MFTAPPSMNLLRPILLIWLCAIILLPANAQNSSELIQVTDLLQIRQLGSVAVAPDGRSVAYTVTTIEEAEEDRNEYRYVTQIFVAPADGREPPTQLTFGEEGASEPAWDPEGERLAFVRTVDGKSQIFVLSMLGGEPFQLTEFEHGARKPRWSPDGTFILFSSTLPDSTVQAELEDGPPWPDERPGRSPNDTRGVTPDPGGSLAEIRAWLDENARDASPRVITRLDFQNETSLAERGTYEHLYTVEVRRGAEPRAVTRGFFSSHSGSWANGGDQIVFSGSTVDDQHPDRNMDSDLYIVNADGSQFRRLLDVERYALSEPVVSPDGATVAFIGRSLDDPGYAPAELGIVSLEGGNPEWLTLEFDRSVADPKWSPNGWELYFTAASNGGFPLFRVQAFDVPAPEQAIRAVPTDSVAEASLASDSVSLDATLLDTTEASQGAVAETSHRIEQLTSEHRGVRSYDVTSATIFYVMTEPSNPYELFAANRTLTQERQLTTHNEDWLESKRLSLPEKHTLLRDSLTIEYWTMQPANYQEGQRYPLVVQIHGGPSAMWGPGEATMWLEFQFFAARGYGIVYSNPRGSSGYGHAFQRANYQDWGSGPAEDVLAVASEAAELPWVDPDQLAVAGGSYAGYLTTWIIAHDDRFEAAVAQRGVYDLTTFMGEGNAWRLVPWHFGGYPWDEDVPVSSPASTSIIHAASLSDSSDASQNATSTGQRVEFAAISPEESPMADVEDGEQFSLRELLHRSSPLTYVDQITTPLLIIHGNQDLRTGVSQSEMLYRSLKILERPVEYVRYPDAGHELTRSGNPRHRMDHILRTYEFIARYMD